MDVILLEKIRNLGDLGDKVSVRPGYGRNFLIPQAKAAPATAENLAAFEADRAELMRKADVKLAAAQERAEALAKLNVVLHAQASEEGKLYGSVGPVEIAKAVSDLGQALAKKEVIMPQGAIHAIGSFTVDLQLHSDVMTNIKIEIAAAQIAK